MTEYIIRNHTDDDYDYEYDDEGNIVYYAVRPNKTQIKKEIAALFALGEEIAALPSAQITALALPEKLERAIREIVKMPHKAARKRQLKFIAQQFYRMDEAVAPILEKMARFKNKSSHGVREHHIVEKWRDRLLGAQHDEALTDLLNEKPQADRQHLRQLMRNAQKEMATNKPLKSPRLLYRYLKTLFDEDEFTFHYDGLDVDTHSEDEDIDDAFDDEYDDDYDDDEED